jgi:hypothetical protein
MEENIGPKDVERIAIVEASEAGRRMIRRKCKKTSTKLIYVRGVLLFSEFLSKGFDDIVNEYRRDIEENLVKAWDKWEEIFADFADFLVEKHGNGATPKTYFEGAKALINANVPKSARIKPESPSASSRSIPPIIMEDLRMVRNAADERERAFIDVLKDSGISRDDAVNMTYKDVRKAIEDPTITAHKMNVYRGKENVEYETWIGTNAIESLRVYFLVRRQRGEEITDDTPIFASNNKPYEALTPKSLSVVFRRLSQKTGIKITAHRLRKAFETYITAGGAHPLVAKYWMGHKIRTGRDVEAHYIIPPENLQRDIYLKAYGYIDAVPKLSAQELSEARIRAELETMSPETRKRYVQQLTRRYTFKPDLQKLLKRIEKESNEENTDCPDGVHCGEQFKQIKEKELLRYLRNGWQIVHKLEMGEVIVRAKT